MAMTGGTAVLLKSTTPSGFGSHKVNLYAYYKYTQSTETNKTTMLLGMYVTTDSGWDIGSWSDSKGSYIGTTSNTFDGTIPNFSGKRWLTENQQMIVSHDDEGKATATIKWKWGVNSSWGGYVNPSGSFTVDLPQIARASVIDSAANVTLGNACSVKWTPKASTFRYKLKFSLGSWSHTTGVLHPNKTSAYTYSDYVIPLDVANQIPNTRTGSMTVTLYTYSDSGATKQVGSADSETFTITVPDNTDTKPEVSMSLTPVGALPSAFAGLYIQGFTKVKATLSAKGKYGAAINTYLMKVDGIFHDSDDDYTSGYLATAGTRTVYGYATDYRGHTGENLQPITVLAYSSPKLEDATAVRCDKDENESESGTYLKIHAKRGYSPVVYEGVQKNFCKIQYRYSDGVSYTQWVTILDRSSLGSDEVTTGALLDGALSTQASYTVHIRATDDIGRYAETYITVPTDKVYMHRDGARNALGLGKYNERDDAVDSAWDIYMNDHRITGLPTPTSGTDAVPKSYVDPADIRIEKSLNAIGWYKIGTITADMCSVTTLTIGGVFVNNQASPSVVDIATQYGSARIQLRLPALAENQISRIGIVMERNLAFGVYAYYNSTNSNTVHVNIHSHMGTFQAEEWVASSISDSNLAASIYLKQ